MNIDDFVPTEGHSILRIKEKPEEAGGLILSQTSSNSAPVIGTIVRTSAKSPYAEGDSVIFRKYAVDELNWTNDGGLEEKLYIIDHEEILAFISNQEAYADEKSARRKQIEERKAGKKDEQEEVLEDKEK